MSPFIQSTNLSLPNENPLFSNYLLMSSINENNRIPVNLSEKPLSKFSRFNAAPLNHSRSKTLQRLPTVDKETCYLFTMNERKQKTKIPYNQSSYPSSCGKTGSSIRFQLGTHYGCKSETLPSINVNPNNFPPCFKDVYSAKESCCLPDLNFTVYKNQELCIQDQLLNSSSNLPNPLKQLDNLNFPSVKNTNLLKPSLSFDNEVHMTHLSQCQFPHNESHQFPQLFTADTTVSTSSINKHDNSSFRKLIPSIRSFRRKLLPIQSFNIPSSRQYSEDCLKSLKPQKSFCDLNSDKYKELNINDSKLKTSHSADTCLHTYSSYNEFFYPQDKMSKNLDNNLKDSTFHRTCPIIPKFWENDTNERDSLTNRNYTCLTSRPLCFPSSYSSNNCYNQQVFVPIMRSESTPCICSPTLRIGVKRRANEVERPTANFAKMWVSQFDNEPSASDLSPLHVHKRFSSRSPESIPDEWGSESNLDIQDSSCIVKSFELNDCCNETLDLQSIEEN